MSDIPRIQSAEPVINGVLKIVWDDGYEAVVDVRPIIGSGKIFAFLSDPVAFSSVRVGEYGSSVYWLDDQSNVIDFGTVSMRQRAEAQADILRVAI